MEFSFFWILLSLSGYAAFYCGQFLLKPVLKKKEVLYLLLFLSAGVIFFIPVLGAVLLVNFTAVFLFRHVLRNKKRLYTGLLVFFLIILVVFCLFYLPRADKIWMILNEKITIWIKPVLAFMFRFMEVFYVAEYFRYIYPPVLTAGAALFFYFTLDKHPKSFLGRFLGRFDHKLVFALIGFWIVFGVFEFLIDFYKIKTGYLFFIETGILNICLYFSFFYMIYGFLLLLYFLKKKGVLYLISFPVIIGSLIISGGFILYLLILLLGIGVSDIWMDYTKKRIKIRPV